MADEIDTVTPVYLCLAFYVLAMLGVSIIANRQNAAAEHEGGDEAAVSEHFLGGKGFGVVVLTLTTLATVFSGFTVVGVPNEAGKSGFTAFRWVGIVLIVGVSVSIVNPRMRRLSIFRNYESPGAFIMDRYNDVKVKFVAITCMCVPQLLYLGVQFHALTSLIMFTTQSATIFTKKDDMGSFVMWVLVGIALLLFFEVIGGMRSVAYTDSVQSAIMVIVFLVVPLVILADYGGFAGQMAPGNEFCTAKAKPADSQNYSQTPGYGCMNWETGKISSGKGKDLADNYLLRTPSTISNLNALLFFISGLAFSIHPHVLQRVLSAKTDKDLKFVARTIYASPWFAFTGMILLGMTATARKMTYAPGNQKAPAFFAFLNEWMAHDSIFKNFLAYTIILAAIAGIMSTADSCLIGVSNTISVDLYRGWYKPHASGKQTIYFGKAVSLLTALISGGIAIYLHSEQQRTGVKALLNYGNLLTFQNGILWQALPAFMFGLWTSMSPKTILTGMVAGLSTALGLMAYQSVANTNEDVDKIWFMLHPDYQALDKSVDPVLGAFMNVFVCLVMHGMEGVDRSRSSSNMKEALVGGESKFGSLTHQNILSYMDGIVEPLTYKNGVFIWLSAFCIVASLIPRIDSISPNIIAPNPGRVELNGSVNALVLGIPTWLFWQLVILLLATALGIIGLGKWQTGGEEAAQNQKDDVGYELMGDGGSV
jgi:Na+/proline symporter